MAAYETPVEDAADTGPETASEDTGEKASQEEVNYRVGTPIKSCGLCEHFISDGTPGPDACSMVQDDISAFGYCDIYKRQSNPFGDQHQYGMQGGRVVPAGPPTGPNGARSPGLLQIGGKTYG